MNFIAESHDLGLLQYTHDDDQDLFACWQDIETQKGYNCIFNQTFEDFQSTDIARFKFWVTILDKKLNQKVGVLRLGLDEHCPDLAIWIYPQYRNHGYGTASFALALRYLFNQYHYQEISAGCYEDNTYSLKMLRKIGFVHYPNEDIVEDNCFTDQQTTQLELRITESILNGG